MFGLIRKLSYSIIPRPDRPWEDDPTSNAPHKGKKRRMSASEEPEPDMEQGNMKKTRGESSTSSVADTGEVTHDRPSTPLPQVETQEVKEVTQGVKDVELEAASVPENVPLPDEESDDLAESSSNATPPPETQLSPDAPVDESASADPPLRRDGPEANVDAAVTENAVISEKGEEVQKTSVVEEEVPALDVNAGAVKTELKRKIRKTKEDPSTAKA